MSEVKSQIDIELLSEQITLCLDLSASRCIPESEFKTFLKPYWNKGVKESHKKAKQKRKQWILEGKPRGPNFQTYSNYKEAKKEIQKTHTQSYNDYVKQCANEIDEASECYIRLFWKLITRTRNQKRTEISNSFADYYESIYFHESPLNEYNDIIDMTHEDELNYSITFSEVEKLIRTLKLQKAPGIDNITNEHIRYGGKSLMCALTFLFEQIRKTGFMPTTWKTGIIIPLYKGCRKPKHDPGNYRPVSLLSVIYKRLEKIIFTRANQFVKIENRSFPNIQQQ